MNILKYKKDIDNCRFCWICRQVCTVGTVTSDETMSPRSRAFILSSIVRGMIDYSDEVADVVYKCCLCGYCKQWCMGGWNPPPFIKAARRDLVERGFVPEKIKKLMESLVNNCNPYGMNKDDIRQELKNKIMTQPDTGDVLMLFGSAVLYKTPEIGVSALELLEKAGVNTAVIKEEVSCGFDLYCIGYEKEAREKIEILLNKIRSSKCKTVVTLSPEDRYLLTEEIKGLGYSLEGIEICHVSEYIAKLIEQKKIKFSKEVSFSAAYHDTSYLVRHCGVIEEPRKVCKAIPGIDYREMLWTREEAHSSGSVIMMTAYPELCEKMIKVVLDDVIESGVDILLTSSGEDKRNFNNSPYKPSTIKIMDLVELVNQLV